MVQLQMLDGSLRPSLAQTLRSAGDDGRRLGAAPSAVDKATHATHARFEAEFGDRRLGSHAVSRVRSYFSAVLRREVLRSRDPLNAGYRQVLRARSALMDLQEAGLRGGRLRSEMVETLGFAPGIVELVLDRVEVA